MTGHEQLSREYTLETDPRSAEVDDFLSPFEIDSIYFCTFIKLQSRGEEFSERATAKRCPTLLGPIFEVGHENNVSCPLHGVKNEVICPPESKQNELLCPLLVALWTAVLLHINAFV